MNKTFPIKEKLRNISYFANVSDSSLSEISDLFIDKKYAMGETITFGETLPEYVYILIDGQVRQLIQHPLNKKTTTLSLYKANHIIGWTSLQTNYPSEFITAASDCTVLRIDSIKWNIRTGKHI